MQSKFKTNNNGDWRTLNSKPFDILQSSPMMRFEVPRLAVKSDIVGTCWHHLFSWVQRESLHSFAKESVCLFANALRW